MELKPHWAVVGTLVFECRRTELYDRPSGSVDFLRVYRNDHYAYDLNPGMSLDRIIYRGGCRVEVRP